MADRQTYITSEGLEKLKKELFKLKNDRRKEMALRIQQAKEYGDLTENAEYIEAKNEQAFIEGRILELENIIKNAIIIKNKKSNGVVNVGSIIKVKSENKEKGYVIVGSQEADPGKGKISNESPLGQAFLGRRVGEIVEVKVPKGKLKFEIVAIL